jgi:hypothetical protein
MDNYLKNTDIEKFCNVLQYFIDIQLDFIKELQQSSINITEPAVSIIDTTFQMNNIQELNGDFKLLYENLDNTVSYDGFCNVLKAIFITDNISINYDSTGSLLINVVSNNDSLYSNYIDVNNKEYVSEDNDAYIGFKAGEWDSLKTFLKKFLQKYLPAGRQIAELNIELPPSE